MKRFVVFALAVGLAYVLGRIVAGVCFEGWG